MEGEGLGDLGRWHRDREDYFSYLVCLIKTMYFQAFLFNRKKDRNVPLALYQ